MLNTTQIEQYIDDQVGLDIYDVTVDDTHVYFGRKDIYQHRNLATQRPALTLSTGEHREMAEDLLVKLGEGWEIQYCTVNWVELRKY